MQRDYPAHLVADNHVEPVPRRVRAFLGDQVVFDTTRALYVWERPQYPQYYIPLDDVRSDMLSSDGQTSETGRGTVELHTVGRGEAAKRRAAFVVRQSTVDALNGTVSFRWDAMDAWFEEDERVFVHPRNPYVRVDAIRSRRTVRVELEGVVLAESPAPVMLFETGLPTRYYLDRTAVHFEHLVATDTVTSCPYKGTTSRYWSAHIGTKIVTDVAWAYDFPTMQVSSIATMIAFYNEKVDLYIDGQKVHRPDAG